MTDKRPLQTLAEDLHDHLQATETLAVETTASRWLGEAQAVAADAASGVPDSVIETRVGQVRELLSNVERTGNDEADAHVEAARETAAEIQRRLDETDR